MTVCESPVAAGLCVHVCVWEKEGSMRTWNAWVHRYEVMRIMGYFAQRKRGVRNRDKETAKSTGRSASTQQLQWCMPTVKHKHGLK